MISVQDTQGVWDLIDTRNRDQLEHRAVKARCCVAEIHQQIELAKADQRGQQSRLLHILRGRLSSQKARELEQMVRDQFVAVKIQARALDMTPVDPKLLEKKVEQLSLNELLSLFSRVEPEIMSRLQKQRFIELRKICNQTEVLRQWAEAEHKPDFEQVKRGIKEIKEMLQSWQEKVQAYAQTYSGVKIKSSLDVLAKTLNIFAEVFTDCKTEGQAVEVLDKFQKRLPLLLPSYDVLGKEIEDLTCVHPSDKDAFDDAVMKMIQNPVKVAVLFEMFLKKLPSSDAQFAAVRGLIRIRNFLVDGEVARLIV